MNLQLSNIINKYYLLVSSRMLVLFSVLSTAIAVTVVDPRQLLVEKKDLFVPTLQEAADVLNKGLRKNYNWVQVDVIDCPNLTQQPFNLANVGLSGNPRIVDVGGTGYGRLGSTNPRTYDFKDLPNLVELNSAFILGASAGSIVLFGSNSECAVDVNVSKGKIRQQTRLAKYLDDKKSYIQENLSKNETRYTTLANYFVSEGKPGKVLKVHVKKRIGRDNFPGSIINVLRSHYEDQVVGLGGTFLIRKGQVKQHLMGNNPPDPYTIGVENWFKYFTMSAPIVAVGRLVTSDYGLNLLDFHFHTFSDHGDTGHYHYDTTPDIVEYEGYFNLAERAYRIDDPYKVPRA